MRRLRRVSPWAQIYVSRGHRNTSGWSVTGPRIGGEVFFHLAGLIRPGNDLHRSRVEIRRHLPTTFLNLRLSPVEILAQTPDEIRETVRGLVRDSANPWLTGVCCINMDDTVSDPQISAIFDAVEELRGEYHVED